MSGESDTVTQLKEIKALLDSEVLTQEEFDAQKKMILAKQSERLSKPEEPEKKPEPATPTPAPVAPVAPVAVAQMVQPSPVAVSAPVPMQPMSIQASGGTISPEAEAIIKHMKCCAIPLLVFSILALVDLFVIIPGCICAGQFLCCWEANAGPQKALDSIKCAKVAAITTIILTAISGAGTVGWAAYTFSTPCYYTWGFPSAGCYDDGWGLMFLIDIGVVNVPVIICASLICCSCGKVEPLLTDSTTGVTLSGPPPV